MMADKQAPPSLMTPPRLRLTKLDIKNAKAIDHLELVFPPPELADDPDVFVLGSRNGVGKTSVLESVALLIAARVAPPPGPHAQPIYVLDPLHGRRGLNLGEFVIRAGQMTMRVDAELTGAHPIGAEADKTSATLSLTLHRHRALELRGNAHLPVRPPIDSETYPGNGLAQLGLVLAGGSSDPVFAGPLLYFHSFRKVQEGSQSVSTLTDPESWARRGRANGESAVSAFKQELLRAMMSEAGLFERFESGDSTNVLKTLNRLVERYAGGAVKKLLPQPDETFDFRVEPSDGGPSFSFDGLSSGQKELISTLFLIWFHTRTQSSIVLIDEPELHLNPEWQRTFVRDLWRIAPGNQYLLATHSEEVFASVEASHRIVLTAGGGAR